MTWKYFTVSKGYLYKMFRQCIWYELMNSVKNDGTMCIALRRYQIVAACNRGVHWSIMMVSAGKNSTCWSAIIGYGGAP